MEKNKISQNIQKILDNDDKYKFIQNKECPFFPCHKNIPINEFNCLFCYCPLYALNKECGGNYNILPNGIKDCSKCVFPHKKCNYDLLVKRLDKLIKSIQEKNNKEG